MPASTSARARSRTCRRRRACARAAPGGTRGCARSRNPAGPPRAGKHSAAAWRPDLAAWRPVSPKRTGPRRPRRGRRAPVPTAAGRARRTASSCALVQDQVGYDRGQRVDAGAGSRLARRTRRGSARSRSGCGRTASRSRRRPSARMPASCPAPRGQPRRVVEYRRAPVAQRRCRTGSPGSRTPRGRRGPATASATRARTAPASAPRASSQAKYPRRDRVDAVGLDGTLPQVATHAVLAGEFPRPARRPRRSRASGRAGRPGGWCPRGWPRRRTPSASARAARSPVPTATGPAEVGQPAALLDVQLDEAPDPAQRLVVASDVRGVVPGGRHRLGHRRPVTVAQPPRAVRRQSAGDDPRPRAGDAEPRALLVAEVDDSDRPGRPQSGCAQRIDRAAAPLTTPSGPSKAPPSGTESRCEPMTTPGP